MLKHLLLSTATLFSATVVSLHTAPIANAATQSNPVQNNRQQLIAKGHQSSHLNSQQKADIKSIHQALTEIYRGFNTHDIEAIVKFDLAHADADRAYLKRLFRQLDSAKIEASTEVKSIELLKLTKNSALVKISQSSSLNGAKGSGSVLQDTTFAMVKHRGEWKVRDGQAMIKSVKKYP